jgi:hypothetical protein
MVIPYDQLGGLHSLMAILIDPARYAISCLPLYDASIANVVTTVVRVRAESAHKSCLDDFNSYEAAERGVAKFLCEAVEEVWYNDLKVTESFYTKITAWDIMSLLDATAGGSTPLT